MHKRTRTRTSNYAAGVGAHAESRGAPPLFRMRSALSLPRAAQSSAFAVIALDGHQGDFQEHRRRQMNFLVLFGDVAPANFEP